MSGKTAIRSCRSISAIAIERLQRYETSAVPDELRFPLPGSFLRRAGKEHGRDGAVHRPGGRPEKPQCRLVRSRGRRLPPGAAEAVRCPFSGRKSVSGRDRMAEKALRRHRDMRLFLAHGDPCDAVAAQKENSLLHGSGRRPDPAGAEGKVSVQEVAGAQG